MFSCAECRAVCLASASPRGCFFVPRVRVGLAQCAVCICSRKDVKPQGISAQRDIPPARCALFFALHRAICPAASASPRGVFCVTNTGGIGAARHTYLFAEGCETTGHFCTAGQITCEMRLFFAPCTAQFVSPPLRRGGVFYAADAVGGGAVRRMYLFAERREAAGYFCAADQITCEMRPFFAPCTARFVPYPLRRGGVFCAANTGGIGAARRMYSFAEGRKATWHFCTAGYTACATRPFIRRLPHTLSRPPLLFSETPLCRASAPDWAHCAHIYPY